MRYAFFLLVLLLGSAQAAEQVRLTNGEWPPYLGETLPHHGVASRIVAEAFALQGVEVQWEFHPWARSLKMAEQGLRDGSAVWFHNPERERHFHISEPVVESRYYFFHRKTHAFDWKMSRICAACALPVLVAMTTAKPFNAPKPPESSRWYV